MARILRRHLVGDLHHAGAKGIGQRPIFENPSDFQRYEKIMRRHLEKLYPEVKLLCYCLMTNHIHQLLFGMVDALSCYMKGLQQEYVQTFNQIRGRSGPLFQRRFWSRPCMGHEDLMRTVHYIDQNPVVAGLVADIGLYAWGSGGDYIHDWDSMPLARAEMGRILKPAMEGGLGFEAAYRSCFGEPLSKQDFSDLTERYRKESARVKTELEERDYCSPEYHMEMEECARLADGMQVLSRQLVLPGEVERHLKASIHRGDLESIPVSKKDVSATGFQLLQVALLKEGCCLLNKEIASIMGVSSTQVGRRLERHRVWVDEGGAYSALAAKVLADLIESRNRAHRAWPRGGG